jgi:hypothetical protein
MAAALLSANIRLIAQLKTFAQKILSETDTPPELQASLIQNAISAYNIPNVNIGHILNMSDADAEAFLSQAIPPAETFDFHGHPVNHFYAAKLERQIRIQKTLLKITYQSEMPQDWVIADMANRLAYNGLTDINDFGVRQEDYQHSFIDYQQYGDSANDYPPTIVNEKINVFYNKQTNQPFPDLNGDTTDCWAKSYEGDGGTAYRVRVIDSGAAVFFASHFRTDFLYEYGGFLKAAALVATFAGLPSFLGESIFGAVGATVPASIETAVGNVAMNTVLTGGDVAQATTGALKKLATGGISDIVLEIDPISFGNLSNVATEAGISGQSVQNALNKVTPAMDELDALTSDLLDTAGFDISNLFPDGMGNAFNDTGEFVALSPDAYASSFYIASTGDLLSANNSVVMTRAEIEAAIGSADPQGQITTTIESRWQATQGQTETTFGADSYRPASLPVPAASTVIPSFSLSNVDALTKTVGGIVNVAMAVKKGTFVPTNTGTTGMLRPQQVGVPVAQVDGSVIVNNGNGTQTVTYPNGTQKIVASTVGYTGSQQGIFAGISNQTLFIGGGVLLAALLLRR